jgi:hypothetical protein
MADHIPGGMPALGRGRDHDPEHGTCLMELTAFLAGEPHSDKPACTHPVLAAVARVVNDASSDPARAALACPAPALIGTTDTGWRTTDALIDLCAARTALLAPPIWRPRLLRALRQTRHRRRRPPTAAPTDRELASAARTATVAAASLAVATVDERDHLLRQLLLDCLDSYTVAAGHRQPVIPHEPPPSTAPLPDPTGHFGQIGGRR